MGSIELVIAIDEKLYNRMKTYHGLDDTYIAVKKGIPLPEGAEILSKEEYSDLCMRAADHKEDKKQESCNDEEHNLQEPNTWHWIPVSYRLPEENKTVMASTTYGVYPEAKYTEEYGWEWAYESGADYWKELDEVEAWMPLPKRYEP